MNFAGLGHLVEVFPDVKELSQANPVLLKAVDIERCDDDGIGIRAFRSAHGYEAGREGGNLLVKLTLKDLIDGQVIGWVGLEGPEERV